jgi:hypothetical protein
LPISPAVVINKTEAVDDRLLADALDAYALGAGPGLATVNGLSGTHAIDADVVHGAKVLVTAGLSLLALNEDWPGRRVFVGSCRTTEGVSVLC